MIHAVLAAVTTRLLRGAATTRAHWAWHNMQQ